MTKHVYSMCKDCPIAALCLPLGGPHKLTLYKCSNCSAVYLGSKFLPTWACHKNYYLFHYSKFLQPYNECRRCRSDVLHKMVFK